MTDNTQKGIFQKKEADKWFKRNFEYVNSFRFEDDEIGKILSDYEIIPKNVLEIGCSAGYRLNGIREKYGADVTGIEPSKEAIEYGSEHFRGVNFYEGTLEDMGVFSDNVFDLVIVGFVFYVVDREFLIRAISEIDRVLQDKGGLILEDFYGKKPIANPYQHITEISAYSFKQNYEQIFTASKLYHLIDYRTASVKTKDKEFSEEFDELLFFATLKKDLFASYQ